MMRSRYFMALTLLLAGMMALVAAQPVVQKINHFEKTVGNEPSKCTGKKKGVATRFCKTLSDTHSMSMCVCDGEGDVLPGLVECPKEAHNAFNKLCKATSGLQYVFCGVGKVECA